MAKSETSAADRRTAILKSLKKSGATTSADALSLKKLYTKVPSFDPFKVRGDVRNMVEEGFLKKVSHEADGVSVYLTASGVKELNPAAPKKSSPKKAASTKSAEDPTSAEFIKQEEGR